MTGFLLYSLELSEVDLASDSFSAFSVIPVRTCHCFGQLFCFFLQTCLKVLLLRTAFLLFPSNLSEVATASDSFSAFSDKPVRSHLCFGQLFCFFRQTCPKSPLLRTAFLLFPANLSELAPASDSFFAFSCKPVRSRPCFGQLFCFFRQTCPKSILLRTAFLLFTSNLSEIAPALDSFSAFFFKPVRSQSCFGQHFGIFLQTCPKLLLLRTAFLHFPSNLSKADPASDNFSPFFFKHVRSCYCRASRPYISCELAFRHKKMPAV